MDVVITYETSGPSRLRRSWGGSAHAQLASPNTTGDGQHVTTVDVIGYSMGGLIVRSYLSGK
jgi:triacylglycerol esterase/lipase EstA (alpha/beta hydrolase family)